MDLHINTDGDGCLSRFKARLVVRGDLQAPLNNKYAAELEIHNFRALIAIANYFDLELKKYDVPTAFLNADIDRKLYAETPETFRHPKGEIMLVLRALYGMKELPILWYIELGVMQDIWISWMAAQFLQTPSMKCWIWEV